MGDHTLNVNHTIPKRRDYVWMNLLADRMNAAIDRWEKLKGVPFNDAEMARYVGCARGNIGDWKFGRSKKMSITRLFKAARYLNVNPEWLGNGVGKMDEGAIEQIPEDVVLLAEALDKLPASARNVVVQSALMAANGASLVPAPNFSTKLKS